tara:strand:- start:1644 stop:2129 length:486 start_codon:yes stop_codon:yes gene_type:complete
MVKSEPRKACVLATEWCVKDDFIYGADARQCGPGDTATFPHLKDCEAFEMCSKPHNEEKFKCEQVSDFNATNSSNHGEIFKECVKWKTNEYCTTDTGAIIGAILGSFFGLIFLLVVSYGIFYYLHVRGKNYSALGQKTPGQLLAQRRRNRVNGGLVFKFNP